ncbi:MAG: tyrosine-type recombinase/integrase [Gammaproteobacteria bacterium]
MKIQRIKLPGNRHSWLVLNDNYLPVKPIQEFTRYLENVERSPNTIRAYAHHLKLYWEYLSYIGKDWNAVKLDNFAEFLGWLRQYHSNVISITEQEAKRRESTVNTILTAVSSFYTFQQQMGNTDIQLTQTSTVHARRYKPLLHHIFKSKPTRSRLIKLKQPKHIPKTLTQDQVKQAMSACRSMRDQFLILLLYESGMRIGQALGLHHVDIKSWDNEIHINPRSNNVNGARTKSFIPNVIHVSSALMEYYTRYLVEECDEVDNEFVFVQTTKRHSLGKALNYRAVRDLFERISESVGFHVSPHMLRHTHATELLRNGWDCSFVQKRLGHTSIQTTINTYSHLSTEDLKKAFQQFYQSTLPRY